MSLVICCCVFFFFKQKTAYEMRISDWSSDVWSSDLGLPHPSGRAAMRMLENEGFGFDNYIDIFDGGPTMTARTDRVKAVRDARTAAVQIGRASCRERVCQDV